MNPLPDLSLTSAITRPLPTARMGAPASGEAFSRLLQAAGGDGMAMPVMDRSSVNILANMVRMILAETQRAWQNGAEEEEGGGMGAVGGGGMAALLPRAGAFRAALPMLNPGQTHPDLAPLTRVGDICAEEIAGGGKPLASGRGGGKKEAEASPVARGELEGIIRKAAQAYGVEEKLIASVIQTESSFNPRAVSPVGAKGLMQLMPGTARELGVTDAFDPEQNVMAGTRYLRKLLDRYQGERPLALAAYNWGMGNLERNPGEMPRETRQYIAKIDRLMAASSQA